MGKRKLSGERVYTNRLIIERISRGDLKFFEAITGDSMVRRYFKEYRLTKEELEDFFEKEIIQKQSPYNLFLSIKKRDETFVGILSMYYISNGCWLIEYALLEAYRKKGYMTEVLNHLFTDGLEFLVTFGCNVISIDELIFEVPNENMDSSYLIQKISVKNRKSYEMSSKPFYDCFEQQGGWTWYRVKL